jgi:ribosomal protein S16
MIELDEPRVYHWLKNGAQPSEFVADFSECRPA